MSERRVADNDVASNEHRQAVVSREPERSLRLDDLDTEGVCLFPLSLAQKRLWFLEQLTPGSAAHNISSGLRLDGELDVSAIRRSVNAIIARHETLRTAFVTLRHEVFQIVLPSARVEIPIVDLRAVAESSREREAYDVAYAESRRPFDLVRCPPLRLLLIRLRDTEHVLQFTMHHLVTDGWSLGLFVEELIEFYEADLDNRKCRLSPLPIQYADYTEWQREFLSGEETARQVRYWKDRLAGSMPLLELPADRVRPAEPSFEGAAISVPLPPLLVDGLKRLAQREETTLFTVLLAAFHALLFRYSDQPDICIGISVAGRRYVEMEALIGLFVNTLVIRIDMAGNPSFTDLLSQVRDASLQAYANQDVPFEKIVEEVHPKRSSTYNPLFQVMMTTLHLPQCEARFKELMARPYAIEVSTSVFDLAAFVIEAADGTLWWRLQYNTALFDAARIQRMIEHYQTLLNSILGCPERRIGDFALPTPDELEQFSAWNSTRAEYPQSCVHHLIADQATRKPDCIAVVYGERQLSYAGLHRRGQHIAAALRSAGVGLGSRVAVCLERSVEMIEGILGILYAGAAYVPLDPLWPAARLSLVMEEAGATVLVTQREVADSLPRNSARQILIEEIPATFASAGLEPQDPESLAYIIFTSGSTGKPKGVCVPHRALMNLLSSMQHEPGLDTNDRLLAVTNLCFDISVLELFLPFITGAQLVIASREIALDGPRLRESLRRHAITVMQATPATWQMLIGAGWNRVDGELKVLCGGEALPVELARKLTERSDFVWNLYGPTETTIWSSLSRVQGDAPVTIGHPIQNTQFYVLDSRMQRVPIGVRGELYIGGHGLARGYLNQPELTNQKFVLNPFDPHGRLYKTGDEVRYCAGGEIEYLGRMDSQIKIRGFRIELREIESAALKQPGIRQAAAMVREDRPGDQQLVCYAVPEQGVSVRAADVRAALQALLPDFMVPTVVFLDSWPLTSGGKIDLAQLPAEALNERIVGGKPRNKIERQLLAIWKQVLGLDRIGITDNFFDLGGHSLRAMELLARIEVVFGRRLPVAAVFKAQTVEQMAATIRKEFWKPGLSLVALQPNGVRQPFFIIPWADGNAFPYVELAKCLGSEQPIYVLESVGVTGDWKPLERIEDIARHFLNEIRTVQPRGPYRLAGFCVGGIVAFEIARQLVAGGEEAPFLALIETWHPKSIPEVRGVPRALRPFLFFVRGAIRHLRALLSLPPRQAGRYFRWKSGILKEMLLGRDVYRGDRYKRNQGLVFEANYRAGSRYKPAPFAGHIVHIVAGNREVNAATDTRLVWCDLAAEGCEVVRTSAAELLNLLKRPQVKELADRLSERLAKFEAGRTRRL